MIIVIDAGNSSIEFGVFKGQNLTKKFRMVTDKKKSKDEYLLTIRQLLNMNKIDPKDVRGVIIGSVVPELNVGLTLLSKKLFGIKPIVVKPGIKTGVRILGGTSQVGADLIMSVSGALKYGFEDYIVIDLGTATTFTLVSDYNLLNGVSIATGIRVSLEALVGEASQLGDIELVSPKKVIGTNTVESLQSGAIIGHACMVEGMIERIENEVGKKLKVIICGGLSELITKHITREIIVESNLILEGLFVTYEKHTS